MAIKFLSKHGSATQCKHESRLRTEIAGMSREVCEACGKVSVGYVENHLGPERAEKLQTAVNSFGTDPDN